MMRTGLLVLLTLGVVGSFDLVQGQGKYNKKLKVGAVAPAYVDLPGVDGKKHSLADLKGKDIVVVCITCNHCPFAMFYEDRIIAFAKKFTDAADSKVALVAINVNNNDEDKLPKMVERAKEKGFTFPYLYDETQKIGRALGASVTPEFFVLDKQRKIAYMGALDDSVNGDDIKTNYLADAVSALLKGQAPAVAESRPSGCSVEYERKK